LPAWASPTIAGPAIALPASAVITWAISVAVIARWSITIMAVIARTIAVPTVNAISPIAISNVRGVTVTIGNADIVVWPSINGTTIQRADNPRKGDYDR
jgi:hypothetical protein